MSDRHPIISAVGKYLPQRIVTNHELKNQIDTSDEWIKSRTGIHQRHIVAKGQASVDMSVKAFQNLKKNFTVNVDDIDLIIVATTTPDRVIPSAASQIQKNISAVNAAAFDISVACSGFVYGLSIATSYIKSKTYNKILLFGVDTMSSILDFNDRNTCVLFGDGAGVVLIENGISNGIIDSILKTDGNGGNSLYMEAGGSLIPASDKSVKDKLHYIKQDGKNVFKKAVSCMTEVSREIIKKNNLEIDDIDIFIAHQANKRIIELVREKLNLDKNKVFINIDKYANTTAATIPICIEELYYSGNVKNGDNVIIVAFGAGYSWGATYLKWNM